MSPRPPYRLLLPLALLTSALLLCLPMFSATVARMDFAWLDFLTARQARLEQADPDIVLVDIDDYSLQAMSTTVGRWPWPRATHAELVEWLLANGARTVGFDIWFSEPDIQRPEFDQYFGEVLDSHNNVFLPSLLMNSADPTKARLLSSYPANLPLERDHNANPTARADLLLPAMGTPERWQLGLINYLADTDGISRHYQIRKTLDGWLLGSLPYVMARYLHWDTNDLPSPLRMVWYGNGTDSPYTRHSYADLWQAIQQGETRDFRDKIVLIGATAAGLHDLRPTPLNAQYPGLFLLANALDNLKNRQYLYHASWYGVGLGMPLLLWLYWRLHRNAALLNTALQTGALLLGLFALSAFAMRHHLLLPATSPAIAAALLLALGTASRYWQEYAARQAAIDMFGRFLDPIVVNQLAEQGLNEQTLAGRQCEISVLFSDIRGFTTMSEKATAAEIMTLLNAYFTRQVGVIFHNHGTLDKFIGDAIMAFWGAPVDDPDHAFHAVNAALDMVDELLKFRDEHGLEAFDVGIGIHSGPAVVGMLGCDQRLEYTAIGDTVNLGSRLEGVTKGIARILVSQHTRDLCGDRFEFIPHGSTKVKGREEPVNIYEPRRKSA